jgi:hypothetical protein
VKFSCDRLVVTRDSTTLDVHSRRKNGISQIKNKKQFEIYSVFTNSGEIRRPGPGRPARAVSRDGENNVHVQSSKVERLIVRMSSPFFQFSVLRFLTPIGDA